MSEKYLFVGYNGDDIVLRLFTDLDSTHKFVEVCNLKDMLVYKVTETFRVVERTTFEFQPFLKS